MKIKILHLSDLHFTVNNTSQNIVLSSLYKKIENDIVPTNKPDILIITGDIAFSGKQKEYEKAKEYIDSIANLCKIKHENIFIVPGNHDVDREKIEKSHIKWWYNFEDEESLIENLSSSDSFPKIFGKLEDYFTFCQQYIDKNKFKKYGQFIYEFPIVDTNPHNIR